MELQPHIYTGKYVNGAFQWLELPRKINGDMLYYIKCDGLETVGSPKNLYTETYADSNVVRVDLPPLTEITRAATDITLELVIQRNNRYNINSMRSIIDYFSDGLTVFWDDIRRLAAVLLLKDATTAETDNYLSMNYIKMSLKMQNIAGYSFYCEDEMEDNHLVEVEEIVKPIIIKSLS